MIHLDSIVLKVTAAVILSALLEGRQIPEKNL